MLNITTEIEIDAPAHIVWNILDDLDSYGEWNQLVPKLSGRTTLGEKLKVLFAPGGKAQKIAPIIHRLVALRALHWGSKIPLLLFTDHGFIVTPLSDERCKFTNCEDFGGLFPRLLWKKIQPVFEPDYNKMNAALKHRAEAIYQAEFTDSLHPVVDNEIKPAADNFAGGTLRCKCDDEPVEIQVTAQALHSYLSGSNDDWKPEGALFSFVSMVPAENVTITANESKLELVESSDPIKRYACKHCGVPMRACIEDKEHAFYGLDYIHTELSSNEGWAPPTFAAYVSDVVRSGTKPQLMTGVRKRLSALGLAPYDALSPDMMDQIAAHSGSKK